MGFLQEKIKLYNLVRPLPDSFNRNSNELAIKVTKSDNDVKNIPLGKIQKGKFYFLHYKDDSNWMKYSSVFVVDYKKVNNLIIIYGVNFCFIPIEIRGLIFDKFIDEKMMNSDSSLTVDFQGMYNELRKLGFEYAIVEYNVAQVVLCHQIRLDYLPVFLYAQHPSATYDPDKLMDIWSKKIEGRDQRHKEMMQSTLKDFLDVSSDFNKQYDVLSGHIDRLQKSIEKYGRG